MVSVSGSKKLKRQMAPLYWGITRKDKRFVVTVRPGPHPKALAIPTAVFLRDTLGIVSTLREAKSAIYAGKVKVDGVVRKSLHHGIGLMDVVELDGIDGAYRLVPGRGALLMPIKIDVGDGLTKLCRVTSKTSIRGGRTQIGFHDGRTVITDADVKLGDTCVMRVPGQEIVDTLRLEEGAQIIVTKGTNAGQTGSVERIEPGTFILPRRALVALESRKIEIQTDNTMVVGTAGGSPVVRLRQQGKEADG